MRRNEIKLVEGEKRGGRKTRHLRWIVKFLTRIVAMALGAVNIKV